MDAWENVQQDYFVYLTQIWKFLSFWFSFSRFLDGLRSSPRLDSTGHNKAILKNIKSTYALNLFFVEFENQRFSLKTCFSTSPCRSGAQGFPIQFSDESQIEHQRLSLKTFLRFPCVVDLASKVSLYEFAVDSRLKINDFL